MQGLKPLRRYCSQTRAQSSNKITQQKGPKPLRKDRPPKGCAQQYKQSFDKRSRKAQGPCGVTGPLKGNALGLFYIKQKFAMPAPGHIARAPTARMATGNHESRGCTSSAHIAFQAVNLAGTPGPMTQARCTTRTYMRNRKLHSEASYLPGQPDLRG